MKIINNISALRTLNSLNRASEESATRSQRLSSGLRINRSSDDSAGMAISNKMKAQIEGLKQANRNAGDGISLIQTAEGALNEVHAILQRMRELSIKAANDSYTTFDLKNMQEEINQLASEVNRIGNDTEFNTKKLLKGVKKEGTGSTISSFAGGAPTTSSQMSINLSTFSSAASIETLDGKGFTIDDVGVYFYNSDNGGRDDGSGIGVDIKGLTNANQLINKILSEMEQNTSGDKLLSQNVKCENDSPNLKFTATMKGQIGNTIKAEDGCAGAMALVLQIGANAKELMQVDLLPVNATTLGLVGLAGTEGFTDENTVTNLNSSQYEQAAVSLMTPKEADKTLGIIDKAIEKVSLERGKMGAIQNRLEYTTNNLGTSEENLTASLSRIQDADMAEEMTEYTTQNVITQAATAMLAQANQRPEKILQLLQ